MEKVPITHWQYPYAVHVCVCVAARMSRPRDSGNRPVSRYGGLPPRAYSRRSRFRVVNYIRIRGNVSFSVGFVGLSSGN